MQQQEQAVPSLRFPEFTRPWHLKGLAKYLDEYRQKTTEENEYEVMTSSRSGLVLQKDYYGENRITERSNIGFNVIPPNFMTYRSRSDDRRFYFNENLLNITGIISSYYPVFKIKDGANSFFISLLKKHTHKIGRYSVGTSQTVLSFNELKKIKLHIPKKEEQQKIAAFLGAVDEKIAQLQKKKELLEEYKKGCMQKLFSQELRFTDDNGNLFPDWEEKRLGEFGSVRTSSVDKLSNSNEKPAKLLNYMDVYRRDHIKSDDLFQDITAPDGQFIASNLKIGDVLFTPSSETPTDIGHSAVVIEDLDNVLFSYHLMRFRPKDGVLLPSFSGYAFKSYDFYVELWKRAQGATRYTISKSAVEESTVKFPKSLEEQKKIADFLSAIDHKIALVTEELDKAKAFKKGLLQQMFV